jgi:hypothetical protein
VVRTEEDIPPRLNRGKERMRHEVEEVDEEMREMEKFLPMLTESLACEYDFGFCVLPGPLTDFRRFFE